LIVHIATINLSLSYFLESESFLWFLLALVMFMSIQKEENKQKRTSPA
jgi:hypothetical protein